MSEYQYVAFRAIDRPVDPKNMKYMESQSTRAEITPWSFVNEYNYGDFGGDCTEILRRGYDVHLHYSNYGYRKLMFRFNDGLSDPNSLKPYLVKESMSIEKDKKGPGVCLIIDPHIEIDVLEDTTFDPGENFDELVELRAEILDGDLRPLYLAHLAVVRLAMHDPELTQEAPLPAGLAELSDAQRALAEYYGLDKHLLAAAAQGSLPLPKRVALADGYNEWLENQSQTTKNQWLSDLMSDPHNAVRSTILMKFRSEREHLKWPTTTPRRSLAQLQAAAEEIANGSKRTITAKPPYKRV